MSLPSPKPGRRVEGGAFRGVWGLLFLTAVGCGDGRAPDAPPPRTPPPSPASQPTAPPSTGALPSPFPRPDPFPLEEADSTVVVISVGSEMAFRPDRLTLRAGTRVRLRFDNQGTLPHNLLILARSADLEPVGIASLDAAATEYVPPEWLEGLLGYTALAVPGSSVEFGFVVPEPGEYVFLCTYPGHFRSMRGIITVIP